MASHQPLQHQISTKTRGGVVSRLRQTACGWRTVADSPPDSASRGWLEECRLLTGVPLSSKATLVPSELSSQWIKTWLQSSASMKGRVLACALRSRSSSNRHWFDLPLRPETRPTLVESCSFRNSEPSTRRPFRVGLKGDGGRWLGNSWEDAATDVTCQVAESDVDQ